MILFVKLYKKLDVNFFMLEILIKNSFLLFLRETKVCINPAKNTPFPCKTNKINQNLKFALTPRGI